MLTRLGRAAGAPPRGEIALTRIQMILALAIAAAIIIRSELAFSNVTVEVKPVTTAISLIPGVTAFGGGLEADVSKQWAVFAEVQHMRLRLSDEQIEAQQNGDDTDAPMPARVFTTMGSFGLRYYGKPAADSWFASMKLLSGIESSRWHFAEEILADSQTKSGFGVDVGYRWLWDSGMLVRLGAGFTGLTTQKREIAALDQPEARYGEAKAAVLDLAPSDDGAFRTALDFGVGYVF